MKFIARYYQWIVISVVLITMIAAATIREVNDNIELPEEVQLQIRFGLTLIVLMVITIIVISSTLYSEYITIRNSRDLLSERMDELSAYSIKLSPYKMRDIAFSNRVSLPKDKAYCYTKLMATDSIERISNNKAIESYEYYIAIAVISGDAKLLSNSSFCKYVEAVRHMEDVKEAAKQDQ